MAEPMPGFREALQSAYKDDLQAMTQDAALARVKHENVALRNLLRDVAMSGIAAEFNGYLEVQIDRVVWNEVIEYADKPGTARTYPETVRYENPPITCQRCGKAMGDDPKDWAAVGWLWRCPDCAKAPIPDSGAQRASEDTNAGEPAQP